MTLYELRERVRKILGDSDMAHRIEFSFKYEDDLLSWVHSRENNSRSATVLRRLRDSMRNKVKHGEPTEFAPRDQYWYEQYFSLCEEEGLDPWW